MKPIIICIIGESGSGKSTIADHLLEKHDIPMIQSRTTRPRRTPDEDGHTFVTEEEFDAYKQENMLAFTTFGDKRYCCLKQDVISPCCNYVIDETGLEYLWTNFRSVYDIYSIKIKRAYEARVKAVGQDRVDRDHGMYYLPDGFFDFLIDNQDDNKEDVLRQVNMIIKLILK